MTIMVDTDWSYSVGYKDSGETCLFISYNGVKTTLSLNAYGTRKLIKLLEATLDDDSEIYPEEDTNDTTK